MASVDAYIIEHRPLLMSVALGRLGNIKDAEDIVQDTFVKWFERDTSHVEETKSYLIKMVKNACANFCRDEILLDELRDDINIAELKEGSLSAAWSDFDLETELANSYAALSKKLNFSEKAVYMLREVFDLDYDEISMMLDKKAENCRKILDRAKQRLAEQNERFKLEATKQAASFELFREACKSGRFMDYIGGLKDEVLEKAN